MTPATIVNQSKGQTFPWNPRKGLPWRASALPLHEHCGGPLLPLLSVNTATVGRCQTRKESAQRRKAAKKRKSSTRPSMATGSTALYSEKGQPNRRCSKQLAVQRARNDKNKPELWLLEESPDRPRRIAPYVHAKLCATARHFRRPTAATAVRHSPQHKTALMNSILFHFLVSEGWKIICKSEKSE